MGIGLITHVLDHAPAELTPAERLLLVAIAEHASDDTRVGWPGMDILTRRTGMTPVGIRKALHRLDGRGWKIRVPSGVDAAGRPVYSHPGHRTRYRIPVFPGRPLPVDAAGDRPEGAPTTPEDGDTPGSPSAERGDGSTATDPEMAIPEDRHPAGMAIPGERDGDTGGSRWRYQGIAGPLNEPSLNPHPPTPHEDQPGPGPGGGGEGDNPARDTPGPAAPSPLDALVVEVHATRPDWAPGTIRDALTHPDVTTGRTAGQIRAAVLALAADPDTRHPGRLRHPGPWWQQAPPARHPRPGARPRCARHPTEPAGQCRACRSEAIARPDPPEPDAPPVPAPRPPVSPCGDPRCVAGWIRIGVNRVRCARDHPDLSVRNGTP